MWRKDFIGLENSSVMTLIKITKRLAILGGDYSIFQSQLVIFHTSILVLLRSIAIGQQFFTRISRSR